jgi:2-deoxy-D-gluconate 3-dehydrogenase
MPDYSSFGLTGKIAVVTGASQGIGRAIALGLAHAGANLVLAKHPEGRHDEIKGVEAEIRALGREALIVLTDVGDVAQVRSLMDKAVERFGRIDILVNNAGWTGNSMALDTTEEEYDRTMSSSLKSVFFASQAAARVMIPRAAARSSIWDRISASSRSSPDRCTPRRKPACTICHARCRSNGRSRGYWSTWSRPALPKPETRKVILEKPGYKEWATTQMLPAGAGISRTI